MRRKESIEMRRRIQGMKQTMKDLVGNQNRGKERGEKLRASASMKWMKSTAGEGYLDTVIKLLIAIVLGALLLAGLYALFEGVVMPRLEQEVINMFDYKG